MQVKKKKKKWIKLSEKQKIKKKSEKFQINLQIMDRKWFHFFKIACIT